MNDTKTVLSSYRRIAVVGLSPNPLRDALAVARFLVAMGYEVVGVNPNYDEIEEFEVYPTLADVPEPPEIVDIFRRNPGPHVDEAIAVGAKAVWMQFGVIDEAAAERAAAAGLDVVMDRCPKVEYPRHFGRNPLPAV